VAAKTVELLTQVDPTALLDGLYEPHHILVVDKTVSKDTGNFMTPKPHDNFLAWNIFFCTEADTAYNLAEVTQVECIMRLSRSWFEIFLNLFVEGLSCLNKLSLHVDNLIFEISFFEVPPKNGSENFFHRCVLKVGKSYEVKVSLKPWGDE